MCEVFFAYKIKGNLGKKDIGRLYLQMVDSGTYANDDGWGIFNDRGEIHKSSKKITKEDFCHFEPMLGSRFLVGHTRNATSGGVNFKSTHPFRYKDAIFVHNGIVSGANINDDRVSMSDSRALIQNIMDRSGDTVSRIKSELNECTGSVSCFLYYKGELFYFRKTSSFTFKYVPDLNIYMGATRSYRMKDIGERTVKGIFDYGYPSFEGDPSPKTIYKITPDAIEDVGDFKMEWEEPKEEKVVRYNYGKQREEYKGNNGTGYLATMGVRSGGDSSKLMIMGNNGKPMKLTQNGAIIQVLDDKIITLPLEDINDIIVVPDELEGYDRMVANAPSHVQEELEYHKDRSIDDDNTFLMNTDSIAKQYDRVKGTSPYGVFYCHDCNSLYSQDIIMYIQGDDCNCINCQGTMDWFTREEIVVKMQRETV
jgi:predicted glutamine amidotransferase